MTDKTGQIYCWNLICFFKDESNKEMADLQEKSTSNVSANFLIKMYLLEINLINAQLTTLSTLMLLLLGW